MGNTKKSKTPKQDPPFQFRPGSDLAGLIVKFADTHDLTQNEACKVLVALAVSSMDCRFYDVIARVATVLGGVNAFSRICVRVQTALEAAHRATGRPIQSDPERAQFIVSTVSEVLAADDVRLEASDLRAVGIR